MFLKYHLIVTTLNRIRIDIQEDCCQAEILCYDRPGSGSYKQPEIYNIYVYEYMKTVMKVLHIV